jgi:hypothetical protein
MYKGGALRPRKSYESVKLSILRMRRELSVSLRWLGEACAKPADVWASRQTHVSSRHTTCKVVEYVGTYQSLRLGIVDCDSRKKVLSFCTNRAGNRLRDRNPLQLFPK